MQRLHPSSILLFFFSYFRYFGLFVLAELLMIFALPYLKAELGDSYDGISQAVWGIFLPLIIALLLAMLLVAYLTWYNYRYEMTSSGFRKEMGIIFKRYVTIPYDNIQNVDIYRSLLDRLLGLSHLMVQTAGSELKTAESELPGVARKEGVELCAELTRRADTTPEAIAIRTHSSPDHTPQP